jgi:hypothetical protein
VRHARSFEGTQYNSTLSSVVLVEMNLIGSVYSECASEHLAAVLLVSDTSILSSFQISYLATCFNVTLSPELHEVVDKSQRSMTTAKGTYTWLPNDSLSTA